jgi:radical SAM superfamily enzyme YgiQ (UPF0313 family)
MPASNKILFIIPPYLPFDEYAPSKVGQKLPTLTPPYGVLSIISYINQNKEYDIEILDLNYEIISNNLSAEECQAILEKILSVKLRIFNPKYVCISALFNTSFPHMKYICPLVKDILSDSILIVGGGLATNLYQDVYNEIPCIDLLCYGEGELPFKKLLDQLPQGKQPHEISLSWISDKSLQMQIKPEYDFINDLDDIPIIDFNYIDLKRYNGRSYVDKDSKKIEVSIHTSRGCPFSCIYCSNYMVHGKKIRVMSNERFLETVKFYIDNYNMDTLLIEDDHFLANKERALYLLEEIRKLNINIEFPNGIAVFKIDEEIAKALADTKVKVLPLAIESGSEYVLHKIINKPLKKEQIYKAIKCLKQYDIRLHAFIVIGFPDEFNKHRQETLDLLLETEIDWAHIFIVVPIAGSRLYKQCEEKGYLLSKDYNDYTTSKCNLKFSGELTPTELEEYSQYINLKVNFLENSNFRNKKYDICKQYFQNVINHYPSQAIAHYMLHKIYFETNENLFLVHHHYNQFKLISEKNNFYKKMVGIFTKEGYNFDRL